MARSRGEISFLWRFLLIVPFAGYLRLFDAFAFARALPNVPFVEYARNFILLLACVLGFVLVLCAAPGRRALLAAGLLLMLSPLWLEFSSRVGSLGARALADVKDPRALSLAVRASGALWGLLMVRGPRGKDWQKAALALALLARTGALAAFPQDYTDAYTDTCMLMGALAIGGMADCAYRGPCLPDFLAPLAAGAWLLLSMAFPGLRAAYALYAGAALALVGITALACARPARRMYWGYIFAFAGALLNAAAVIYASGAAL